MKKIVIVTEGQTEKECLGPFLHRWLDGLLQQPIRLDIDTLRGWPNYVKDIPQFVKRQKAARGGTDVHSVFGLLDLHQLRFQALPRARFDSALDYQTAIKEHLEATVGHKHFFRQHFAVHELEAWLLAEPRIFPPPLRGDISRLLSERKSPEAINDAKPPSHWLNEIYRKRPHGTGYRKRVDGKTLFDQLAPEVAAQACPSLKLFLADLLAAATEIQQGTTP